jgi:putative tricarboxylic transport membrane protein
VKLNDAVWGALLIFFSAAVLTHVQSFPSIPGQKVGPALFPGLLAVGLAVCAVVLIVKGLAARAKGGDRARWAELDGWTRSRRHVLAFGAVIGVNLFYILLVDRIGFILTGVVISPCSRPGVRLNGSCRSRWWPVLVILCVLTSC